MSYRFTVFSSTYNRAHTLPYVHESLKHQTFQDFEWLIVDDGSTDETQELIKVWQKRKFFPLFAISGKRKCIKKSAFNQWV